MQHSDDAGRSALDANRNGRSLTVEAALALSFSVAIGAAALLMAAGLLLTR